VLPDARDNAVFVSSLSRPPANLGDNPITTALTGVSQWVPWPIKVQPKHRYGIGTMAFIGDAAHAMPPYLAQGGAMAIEDAAVLSAAVARHGLTAEAVAHYGAQRTGRVKRLAAQTRRQGLIYHLPPPISFGRDMALRTLGAEGVLSQVSWIYGWNPPTP
ncbi:MAG: FAD-dependent monooxygenase, partial [Pseudomonadota bacterium]